MNAMRIIAIATGVAVAGAPVPAAAEVIGGVEFPQGNLSFADQVVSYANLPASVPALPYRDPTNALGAPDYVSGTSCASQASCTFVTLGAGGQLVVRFTDNVLTGSDSSAFDLWIFEIGPDVEDTLVDVSIDGMTWSSVGFVTGSTRGIDIDAFGFGLGSAFSYVRLTDVLLEGQQGTGGTVGADIDAIGAISTRRVDTGVPEASTWALLIAGFGVIGGAMRRRSLRSALA